jgi:hypothetical protein
MMITDLQKLISQWTERMGNTTHPLPYRDALGECIYELNCLITKTLQDEMTEQDALDYLLSQEADSYLSSMEAHEDVA